MSTVDQAVEAGARALKSMSFAATDMAVSEAILRTAWPVLSGPIRELHKDAGPSQGFFDGDYSERDHCCGTCGEHGEYGIEWPCPTMIKIIETDKELGL